METTTDERPVCADCKRPIPEGVDAVIGREGFASFCGPCLWDSFTPGWREHKQHAGSFDTCGECTKEAAS